MANLNVISSPTNQSISGVVSANPQQKIVVGSGQQYYGPLSVSSSPGGMQQTTYNPQQTAPAKVIQSTAPVKTVQGTSNPQSLGAGIAASPTSVQTFAFADGSVVDAQGNIISGPTQNPYATSGGTGGQSMYGGAMEMSAAQDLNTPTPSTTTDSTSLSNDAGYSDILKMLSNNLTKMDSFFSNLSAYSTVGPEERTQQAKVASDQAAMTALGYQAKGLYNPDNQAIALPFLTGQAQNKMVGAGIQSQLDQSVLNYMQGNRQFAFNSAATIFDASRNNVQTMLDVYSKAAPQNVGTNYNPTTGALNAIMRNPLTGATYVANLGNIGAQKSFTSTNIATDPYTGALTFVGTTNDGRVVTQPISQGFGLNSTVNNPLQGLGQVSVPGYGGATNPSTGQPWRTDANNNPIAAAVTTGGTNQFTQALDQAGVSWTYGSQFPGNPNMSTIKILGDPVEGARAILSNSNALQGWYASHTGKAVVAQYGVKNNTQFAAAPRQVQNAIIDGIYKAEVGSGILTHPQVQQSPTLASAGGFNKNVVASLPPGLQQAVKYLPDGTPYFDGNQITSAQIPMAQAFATQTGIRYVEADSANKLNNIAVTQQNLADFKTLVDKTLSGGVVGKITNPLGLTLGNWFGSTTKTNFDSFRSAAINAIQGLAAGGGGFRLTQAEINTATDNLPRITDSREQAQIKMNALNKQLSNWINQILPGYGSNNSGVNYTQTLNNLLALGNQ